MRIRDANPADIEAIEALEQQCFSLPWSRETLLSQLTGEGRILLAAEEDGALAGYMGLQYVLDEGYITNVCTAPDFRRRGVARALLREAELRARALFLSFLTLEVRASNAPAIALYSSLGFRAEGIRKNYYERPLEDAVIMTKMLNEV